MPQLVVATELMAAGVPCGPINTIAEGVQLAERLGLEPRVTVGADDHAVDLVRNPIRFSDSTIRYHRAPPALGADSDAVRAWLMQD